jgi:WD40 repeat protein/tRNA A-37 threonylcarbamoyl transferase component Bud32
MSELLPTDDPLPLQTRRQVEPVCDAFDRAWREGGRPRLEDFLAQHPEPVRSYLLRALLRIELEYRGHRGESPPVEEYRERFRDDWPRLTDIFLGDGPYPTIPGYEILGKLGIGAQGVVYKARQVKAERVVALKMILSSRDTSPEARLRFQIEAEAVARLAHPNVVRLYEVDEQDGLPFFSLEYCPGGNLKQKWASQPQPPREAAALLEKLAQAVAAAHAQGLVHRDLKPANVLLGEDGTPKIADFGLARRLEGGADLTQTWAVMGTPAYMAPEQAAGQANLAGPAADIYSLGVLLYEALTGRVPFRARKAAEMRELVLTQEPPPPRKLQAKVPADLETICLKCLQKEPGQRYQSAGALAEDLRLFLEDRPLRWARPVGRLERLARWCRRNPALAAAGGLAIVLLLTIMAVSVGWAIDASQRGENLRGALATSEHERRRAQEQLAERSFDRALVECERGDVGLGLLWMARSLETAPEGAEDLRGALRASLAGWRSRLFALTDCHPGAGKILAFDPDGRTAWAAEPDGSVRRRVLATGEPVGLPLSHDSKVTAVAVSQDGNFVLTAAGPVARLWEVATGKLGPTFHPPGALDAIALSPDGQTVLTADRPREAAGPPTTIRLWDARSGRQFTQTCRCEGLLVALALSPEGRTLLAAEGTDGAICSWDVATGNSLGPLPVPRGGYRALAYSPDGQSLLTGSRGQTARLWDVGTGRPLGPPLYHGAEVHAVAFRRDGRTLLTADARNTVRTWAVAHGPSPASVLAHDRAVRTVAISPDGQTVATGSFDRKARLWSTRSGAQLRELPHEAAVAVVLFSPDGRTLLTADWKDSVRLWDTASGQRKGEPLQHRKWAHALAFSVRGHLVVTGSYDGTARIWDAVTGAPLATFRHGDGVVAVAFDPEGTRVLTGGTDGTAQVWDLATGQRLGEPLRHRGTVRAVAFNREGDRALTASVDGTARLWDAATGQPRGQPMPHGGEVWVAAFSPDGRRIVTGSWDGTARLWDAATGQPRGQPLAHGDQVWAVAFSPDSRWVVTGSWDGTARLWDAATGRPLGPRLPHPGKVWAVAFGAGNRMVLTGSEDGKARLWQMPAPLEGPVKRVVLWAQVLTGMELDADGGVHVLDPQTWQQRRQKLKELGGPPVP